ncbi:diphthine--ammonia ligase [archaeon]|nr:diphthine--ammonia ligase [archaeon]
MKSFIEVRAGTKSWEKFKESRLISDLAAYNIDTGSLLKLIEKNGIENLDEIRGAYAFAYYDTGRVYLARDLLGLVPLFYATRPHFAFASKKKALVSFDDVTELNPREILCYDEKTKRIEKIEREFFKTKPEIKGDILGRLEELLFEAVKIRIPKKKFGLLLSGGVDSSLLAFALKKLGADFTCYTAALDEDARDLKAAKSAAEKLGLTLKQKIIGYDRLEEYLEKVAPLVEDPDVVKIGVALPTYVACEMAQEDGCEVIFSGLGPDELFGGYRRHKIADDINAVCLKDLENLYLRNTYRDYTVTKAIGLELVAPYLDLEFVKFALRIPAKHKTDGKRDKIILRELAEKLGLDPSIAQRKKRAAQYGSRFDWGLDKLARSKGIKKSEYLKLASGTKFNLGVLFSSGKDSTYALHIAREKGHTISCLISLISRNPDSYMFHTQNVNLAKLQAEALGIPHIEHATDGEKEKELKDLEKAIKIAKEKYQIEGVVTGALFSTYQKDRIEKVCEKLGLIAFSPLWHKSQIQQMREVVDKFEFMFSSVAAEGLDASWLGRRITIEDVNSLIELNRKSGINVAGEGGEFESIVLDGPMFKKKVKIDDFEIIEESENTARMVVKKASLIGK